jgi:hypothetical protein
MEQIMRKQKKHLTDALVRRLPVPERGNKVHYDSDVVGFGLSVTRKCTSRFRLELQPQRP